MPRVKRGTMHVKKRHNLLKQTKGFKWGRKNLMKQAKTAATLAGANAYKDRRHKKVDFRALWQIRISAFAKEQGLSYSRFIDALHKNKIELDRKILADLAINNKKILQKILATVK